MVCRIMMKLFLFLAAVLAVFLVQTESLPVPKSNVGQAASALTEKPSLEKGVPKKRVVSNPKKGPVTTRLTSKTKTPASKTKQAGNVNVTNRNLTKKPPTKGQPKTVNKDVRVKPKSVVGSKKVVLPKKEEIKIETPKPKALESDKATGIQTPKSIESDKSADIQTAIALEQEKVNERLKAIVKEQAEQKENESKSQIVRKDVMNKETDIANSREKQREKELQKEKEIEKEKQKKQQEEEEKRNDLEKTRVIARQKAIEEEKVSKETSDKLKEKEGQQITQKAI